MRIQYDDFGFYFDVLGSFAFTKNEFKWKNTFKNLV